MRLKIEINCIWTISGCQTLVEHVYYIKQIENTLEVGANYHGSLVYEGIFTHRFVAANVSKETPYLSGW